ncbi:hypothetical protein [Streptomyces sulphureus]|uniref:hypothetical protein n=1 Tax=Streptomyces sulphureus TaxID=47758 RepID=UPI00036EFB57|nr:hypothetical protein [Streptomyces sulphureus]
MYDVTIKAQGIEDRGYHCKDGAELRTLVYGVFRVQGEPVKNDSELIAEIGGARSAADLGGVGSVGAGDCTVAVAEVEDWTEFSCDGHESLYVGLGETVRCDGTCGPRRRFDRAALVDLSVALDDAELDATGGCGGCGLEAGQMCAACRKCNCERHDVCVRPSADAAE